MAGRVDLESLLWEAREVLRDLSKVSRAQSAEIERLGGCPWEGARELQERADGVVASVAIALDQLQADADNAQYFAAANEDDDAAMSDASSSYAARAEAIDKWVAQSELLREQFESDTAFPVGVDSPAAQNESHINTNTFDFEDDESVADGPGDTSFVSASSSFWRTDNFNWADEPSRDEEDEEEEFDTSGSMLNVPELLDDSVRFDSASDSGESFASEQMLGHCGVDSDSAETVCSEREPEEPILPKSVMQDAMNHRVIRGRTVSFNVKMSDELDEEEANESDSPTKGSASGYHNSILHHKSTQHLRRLTRMGSLPNINRLVTLQE